VSEGCTRLDTPCVLAAGSGLLLLIAVAESRVYPYVPASVSLVSLAVGVHLVASKALRLASLVLSIASWVLVVAYAAIGGVGVLALSVGLAFAASAVAAVGGGAGPGLAVFASSYMAMTVFSLGNNAAEAVFSAGYILLGGIIASLLSGKPHPLMAVLASPLPLALGGPASMMLSLLAYMAILAGSGAVRWIGCPFRLAKGLVFNGFLVGLVGALGYGYGIHLDASLGLYSAGLLLLLAGVLTPASPPRTSSS